MCPGLGAPGITSRDALVIYGVMTSDEEEAQRFLTERKARLKEALQQVAMLIVERHGDMLEGVQSGSDSY